MPVGIGLAVKALAIPILAPVFIAIGVGGAWGIARAIFRPLQRKRSLEIEALGDRLTRYVEETIAASGRRRIKP